MDSPNSILIAVSVGAFFAFTPGALVLVLYVRERVREREALLERMKRSEHRQAAIAQESTHE